MDYLNNSISDAESVSRICPLDVRSTKRGKGLTDWIKDWSKVVTKLEGEGIKKDKNYNKHMIKPCKMIASIGPTGSGKSNALLEFLSRKNGSFCEVILFSGSTTDEDL